MPADEAWEDLLRLTEAELEDQARRGSVLAMTALGFNMVSSSEPGDSRTVAGFKWLDEATVQGSTFAARQYGELALTHFVSGDAEQGFRNQVSASYYALAYLMGDSTAIPGFQVAAGTDPTGQSISLYLGMGMSRLQSVQASRVVRGLQPLALEPRPVRLTLGIIEPPGG